MNPEIDAQDSEPQLNTEYPGVNEAQLIEDMVALATARMKPQDNHIRRGQHAKSTGCVHAQFTVRNDVRDNLLHGVFRERNKTFNAIVRFSNGSESLERDSKHAARGMAIKLLDVDGTPALPDSFHHCQDFVMINHPVFPFATPAEYVEILATRASFSQLGEAIGQGVAVTELAVIHPPHFFILLAMQNKVVANPLEIKYWSGSPYWLGSAETSQGVTVKYSVSPRLQETELPEDIDSLPDDYLRQTLAQHLKTKEAVFDFNVQIQTDPIAMPIEDVTKEWDEAVSKPIPIATLTIGVQDVDSAEGLGFEEQCEAKAFSPWNALAEHRPMGGINRLRKAVYLASQAKRGASV